MVSVAHRLLSVAFLIIVQVAAHNHAGSCWFVIHDKVYDVTSWLKDHPGGDKVMLKASGCAVCNVHAHTHARRHA